MALDVRQRDAEQVRDGGRDIEITHAVEPDAFFYAGARALLVTHWQIASAAAVRLTTETFAHLQRDATIGRAEALRRAMLAHIDDQT